MTGRALRQRIAQWIGGPETRDLRAQVNALAEQCVYLESDSALQAAEHRAAELEPLREFTDWVTDTVWPEWTTADEILDQVISRARKARRQEPHADHR